MLNTFPDLLSFSFIAPLILRIFIGSYFLKQTWVELVKHKQRKSNSPRILRIIGGIGGILLIIGFLTQVTSLFLILMTIFNIVYRIKNKKLTNGKMDFYIIVIGVLISLMVTGAGFMAIDMPL